MLSSSCAHQGARFMVQTRSAARAAAASVSTSQPGPQTSGRAAAPSFERINNFRDLADGCPNLHPGRLFRSAMPSKGTDQDARTLYTSLGIRDMVDLRSTAEIAQDSPEAPVWRDASYCTYAYSPATQRVLPNAAATYFGGGDVMHSRVALLEKSSYYYALLQRMGIRQSMTVLFTSLAAPQYSRQLGLEFVNQGGLEMLYEIILDTARPQLAAVLRLITASAQAGRPLLFFCRAGKDRTGVVAALVLSIMGATDEQIIADYHRSDAFHMVALAGIEAEDEVRALDRAKFERAPREAMQHALRHMRQQAGAVPAFLDRFIGFSLEEQEQLRVLLEQPPPLEAATPEVTGRTMGRL